MIMTILSRSQGENGVEENAIRSDFSGRWLSFKRLSPEQVREITRTPRNADWRAFYGDPALKQRFLERAADHRAADQIVHGVYWRTDERWDDSKAEYKAVNIGCAVGCLSHASESAHHVLSKLTGVPQALYQLTDMLFESHGLMNGLDTELPGDVMAAIPVGSDQSRTAYRIMAKLAVESDTVWDEHRANLLRVLNSDATPKEMFTVLKESVRDGHTLHVYGITTFLWERMADHVDPNELRTIMLDELAKAPVPVVAVPAEQQSMADFMKEFVVETEKVLS